MLQPFKNSVSKDHAHAPKVTIIVCGILVGPRRKEPGKMGKARVHAQFYTPTPCFTVAPGNRANASTGHGGAAHVRGHA